MPPMTLSASPPSELPEGLTTRALTLDDARAVFELAAAQEQHDIGTVEIEHADIVSDWQRPSFDVATRTVGVFDGDELVAYGELTSAERGDAAVRPDYRGRGIGRWVAAWMQAKAQELGSAGYGSPVPQGSPGDRLLEHLGYRVRWTSWVLKVPEGSSIPERALPEGYAIREARPDEYDSCWTVVEDAFLEWSVREREPFEDFLASTVQRPGFEPWHMRVAVDPSGAVVGVAFLVMAGEPVDEVYVDKLAVRRDQRGRGLAQSLLVDAFREGREHGAPSAGLSTDSRTGALSLYEKVGMVATDTWVNRAIGV